jgi:hypothetical protein
MAAIIALLLVCVPARLTWHPAYSSPVEDRCGWGPVDGRAERLARRMSDLFDQLDAPTAAAEAGYVNNPADPGGETIWGITKAVARENGYAGPMVADDPRPGQGHPPGQVLRQARHLPRGPASAPSRAKSTTPASTWGPGPRCCSSSACSTPSTGAARTTRTSMWTVRSVRHGRGAGQLPEGPRRARRDRHAAGAERAAGRALRRPGRGPRGVGGLHFRLVRQPGGHAEVSPSKPACAPSAAAGAEADSWRAFEGLGPGRRGRPPRRPSRRPRKPGPRTPSPGATVALPINRSDVNERTVHVQGI